MIQQLIRVLSMSVVRKDYFNRKVSRQHKSIFSRICIRILKNKRQLTHFSLQVYRLKPEANLSLTNPGGVNWEKLACLAIIYLICFFSMWKGIKTSGKVIQTLKYDHLKHDFLHRLSGLQRCFLTLF